MNIDLFKSWLTNEKRPPLMMGVLNVTPDSFSDGGSFYNVDLAFKHAIKMEKDGADLIDIGGESSRPGAEPIGLKEELKRVIPVIEKIRQHTDIVISVDTYKSEVAEQAIKSGANIINDISGLRFSKNMAELASKYNIPLIVMHMLGNPKNMQDDPVYNDVIEDLTSFFQERIEYLVSLGIQEKNIIIDPEYLDITIPPQTHFTHDVPKGYTVFAYIMQGNARFQPECDQFTYPVEGINYFDFNKENPCEEHIIGKETLVLYDDQGALDIATMADPVRFLLISGKPIHEPVAWYGPIVMNTREELRVAFEEYQQGTFLKHT